MIYWLVSHVPWGPAVGAIWSWLNQPSSSLTSTVCVLTSVFLNAVCVTLVNVLKRRGS